MHVQTTMRDVEAGSSRRRFDRRDWQAEICFDEHESNSRVIDVCESTTGKAQKRSSAHAMQTSNDHKAAATSNKLGPREGLSSLRKASNWQARRVKKTQTSAIRPERPCV